MSRLVMRAAGLTELPFGAEGLVRGSAALAARLGITQWPLLRFDTPLMVPAIAWIRVVLRRSETVVLLTIHSGYSLHPWPKSPLANRLTEPPSIRAARIPASAGAQTVVD